MSLLDILQGAGHVLDTPGSVVRGLLSGQAGRAFGGIFDPEQRVSGQDMLNSWGIDGGELGGMAAGIATDPLMWGGGALLRLLGRGGEAAATGARAAEGLGAEANAAGKAATALEAAPSKFVAGDASIPISRGADVGGTIPGNVESLVPLRRSTTFLKDFESGPINNYRAVGDLSATDQPLMRANDAMEAQQAFSSDLANSGKNLQGMFYPEHNIGVINKGADPGTLRHEMMHALINSARGSDRIGSLPLVPRMTANLLESTNPTAQGAGRLMDELLAHSVGGGTSGEMAMRGLPNQLKAGFNFLDNPSRVYGDWIGEKSPLIASLYRSFPYALRGAAAGGAGLGAYAGGNAVFGGGE